MLRAFDWIVVTRREWVSHPDAVIARVEAALPYPLFVKPANLGSSVGISKVRARGELTPAIDQAAAFDRKVIVEVAVAEAREIECAVLGNSQAEASVPGEIVPSREFYDYEAKYLDAGSRTEIPAPLDEAVRADVQRQSIAAFAAIDGSGLARVDFLLSRSTGVLYLNEINTMPGFTTISMYSKLWAATHLPYADLIDRLIALAIERHSEKQQLRTSAF